MSKYNKINKNVINDIRKEAIVSISQALDSSLFYRDEDIVEVGLENVMDDIEQPLHIILGLLFNNIPSVEMLTNKDNKSLRLLTENNIVTKELTINNDDLNIEEIEDTYSPGGDEFYIEITGGLYFSFISVDQPLIILKLTISLGEINTSMISTSSIMLNVSDIIEKSKN